MSSPVVCSHQQPQVLPPIMTSFQGGTYSLLGIAMELRPESKRNFRMLQIRPKRHLSTSILLRQRAPVNKAKTFRFTYRIGRRIGCWSRSEAVTEASRFHRRTKQNQFALSFSFALLLLRRLLHFPFRFPLRFVSRSSLPKHSEQFETSWSRSFASIRRTVSKQNG